MRRHEGGARLMIGLAGPRIDETFASTLASTKARSVILFARNLVNAQQARMLTEKIRGLVPWPLVIAIDQEGGHVIRINEGVTQFPGNMSIGATHDPGYAQRVGTLTAREMAACGIDLVLAPVVDLQVEVKNPIVGFRSFGGDRQWVTAMAAAMVKGLSEGGCSACLKHFPGLGLADMDPHESLPKIRGTLEQLFDPHVAVFEEVLKQFLAPPAVMTTHVVLPDVDPENMATVSRKIVGNILRERLGFQGCVLTDDLEMGGANPIGTIGKAAVGAAQAGHDLILVCHQPTLQREAALALEGALECGELDAQDHETAIHRIDALGRRHGELPIMPDLAQGASLARRISQMSPRFLSDPHGWRGKLPIDHWHVVGGTPQERAILAEGLKNRGLVKGTLVLIGDDSDFDEWRAITHGPSNHGAENTIFVLLRSPRDILQLPEDAPVVTAMGRLGCHLSALAHFLTDLTKSE